MALYPAAVKRLIPPGPNDPRIKPRVAILHVDAGNAASLFDYFKNRSGGVESHFHVRGDGVVEQYRDTDWQADANLDANDFAVSIETQGLGAGEWTPAQLAAIKALLLWLHETHDIPLRKCPRWDGSGVGYHTLFGSPSHWTPVAKSCPGPGRIRQFHAVLVPWMAERSTPPTTFTAATANIEAGLPISKVLADVRTVLRLEPDVIGFQEIGGTARATAMRALLVAKGYRFVRPGGTPDPVAYRRKRFRLLKRYRWFLSPETFVGRLGAGPATLREKRGTVQVLEDRATGQVVGHINAHMAPSIWLGGERERLHSLQVVGLAATGVALQTEVPDAVLVYTFDGNTDDRARLAPITDLGVRWGVERVTFGARAIDYVGATAEPAGSKAVKLNSDHKALARRFRIDGKATT